MTAHAALREHGVRYARGLLLPDGIDMGQNFTRESAAKCRPELATSVATKTCAANPACRNCRPLTLTASRKEDISGISLHLLICVQAVSRTHCPIGKMSPLSSARGMNPKTAVETRWHAESLVLQRFRQYRRKCRAVEPISRRSLCRKGFHEINHLNCGF